MRIVFSPTFGAKFVWAILAIKRGRTLTTAEQSNDKFKVSCRKAVEGQILSTLLGEGGVGWGGSKNRFDYTQFLESGGLYEFATIAMSCTSLLSLSKTIHLSYGSGHELSW